MKGILLISCVGILLSISGCSQTVPKCGDTETVDLVKEIADSEMVSQLGSEAAKLFTYSVDAIRTTSTNEQTGAHECSADLDVTAKNNNKTSRLPITYTVEITDSGEHLYVNVYGL
ncbi:hypothetical protein [Oceanisphaera ostreae]|uniref:Uncharacterized protein n=1 Tax=Oceanisphaera ostreae TaxID=914151 RepID=A0ABW3KD23_9GAMM